MFLAASITNMAIVWKGGGSETEFCTLKNVQRVYCERVRHVWTRICEQIPAQLCSMYVGVFTDMSFDNNLNIPCSLAFHSKRTSDSLKQPHVFNGCMKIGRKALEGTRILFT